MHFTLDSTNYTCRVLPVPERVSTVWSQSKRRLGVELLKS
jgi:hypothetical protein